MGKPKRNKMGRSVRSKRRKANKSVRLEYLKKTEKLRQQRIYEKGMSRLESSQPEHMNIEDMALTREAKDNIKVNVAVVADVEAPMDIEGDLNSSLSLVKKKKWGKTHNKTKKTSNRGRTSKKN
eukprot:TRINITY_DN10914_c0_g1_i1.p1 TRINITY_DN10914_c0_g1~~TRINITY_DN10914_c0_g1_i1.p1  ORF type:complete len:124 (-),score=36.63 TRINITY_DN10914_c0_g1_i1:113-484(-)